MTTPKCKRCEKPMRFIGVYVSYNGQKFRKHVCWACDSTRRKQIEQRWIERGLAV